MGVLDKFNQEPWYNKIAILIVAAIIILFIVWLILNPIKP